MGEVTIAKGVNAKIYFSENLSAKASDVINNNVDHGAGVYKRPFKSDGTPSNNANGTPRYGLTTNTSRSGHFQFYAISPAAGGTQTININPGSPNPKEFWGTIYAPDANVTVHGNPEIFGAIVCKNFTGNGNTGFHFDKAL